MNHAGKMIAKSFIEITKYYPGFDIDTYIVMPDHFHGIIIDNTNIGAFTWRHSYIKSTTLNNSSSTENILSLGDVVGRFKSITTHRYIRGVRENNWQPYYEKLWQRNYFDRIIRDKKALYAARKYIIDNPLHWKSYIKPL
jgi:REP element-mobilizing transposase RayT